ncbi:MAG: 2-oxo-4-hydroxy-4-carboxy-5-ureidoimidazoline decarboxylase, partial [Flavisolibacter sp.]
MTLDEFNKQEKAIASDSLFSCCSAEKWTMILFQDFPFQSVKQLIARASSIWYEECIEDDWLEAFSHHPKIGDVKNLEEKFASTKDLAMNEQSAVRYASTDLISKLADANKSYEEKFGFIFIVSASGKSAEEMLRLIYDRLKNTYHEELQVAMGEQHKITILRLKKLLSDVEFNWMRPSQITTHVLDTTAGKPAQGITIRMQQQLNGNTWQTMAQSVTNKDGRINDLLPPDRLMIPGIYK